MPNITTLPKEYSLLRRKVEETLLLGRQRIEAAKVQTYWQTGKLIHEHILRYESRAEHYGNQVIEKLAEDLEVSKSILWYCVQFARTFKILDAHRESLSSLSWMHFRKLMTIPDEQTRISFARRAQKSGWGYRELARKIREEVKDERDVGGNGVARRGEPAH